MPSTSNPLRFGRASHLTLLAEKTRFRGMALLFPARLSSRTAATHLGMAGILLSPVAFEVFDIDPPARRGS